MIYLIGGAPRAGKTFLAQQLCTTLQVGWISTDLLLEDFAKFPERSKGYSSLPEALRRQIVQDVPRWSAFIRQEADRFGHAYIDMAGDFSQHLAEAESVLTIGV